jgi:hypothetical protein
MAESKPDLRKTVQFHAAGTTRFSLLIALLLFFLSVLAAATGDERNLPLALAGVAAGLIWSGFEVWRLFNPSKPMVVLSSMGVDYRMPGGAAVFIPWGEIHDVSAIEIDAGKVRFEGVTALKVSKRFYEKEIEDQLGLFGGGNKYLFVMKGNFVQIALHHGALGVKPRPLREAISARWYTFNNRDKTT